MTKLAIIGIGIVFVVSIVATILLVTECNKRDEKGRRININDRFDYAVFDGHEYVVYGEYTGGIAHSPRCECNHKNGGDAPAKENRDE